MYIEGLSCPASCGCWTAGGHARAAQPALGVPRDTVQQTQYHWAVSPKHQAQAQVCVPSLLGSANCGFFPPLRRNEEGLALWHGADWRKSYVAGGLWLLRFCSGHLKMGSSHALRGSVLAATWRIGHGVRSAVQARWSCCRQLWHPALLQRRLFLLSLAHFLRPVLQEGRAAFTGNSCICTPLLAGLLLFACASPTAAPQKQT